MLKPISSLFGLLAGSLLTASVFAQSQMSQSQLAAAIEKARQEQVDALAPNNFAAAAEALGAAARDAEKGRNPDKVRAQLNAGAAALQRANTAAAAARETLQSLVATRTDALSANAPKFAPESWQKADQRFREATSALERNDTRDAQKRSAEANVLLREVEMTAIRNGVLNEARGVIAQADAAKVEKFAPRTLAAAKRYLSQAEQEINRNRYEPAAAAKLAAQAGYEARHSIYLAQLIQATLDKKGDEAGLEELLLSWESSIGEIAQAAELESRFDKGIQPVTQQLLKQTQDQRQEARRLARELEDRNEQITALNAEMTKLEARLGGVSQERIALQRRVDAQERVRANVATIEGSFGSTEARVVRQGDDIVISLLGIRFPSGRSTIDGSNAALMNKVRDALKLFPDSSIVVEGHTDSNGSDSANLILSQDRADAVRQYLVTNFGTNPEKISSIGYGEARPVATNETADGRARNRRIDLVIHGQ
jgi:outer membrane protein OmpA-like peptidoglycan-associated protein